MPRRILISVRRDSAENWTTINPTLDNGEFGYEIDSAKAKLGDGLTAWNSLRYLPDILHDNVVNNRMLRDSAAVSVIGRDVNNSGNPGDIIATIDEQVLRRDGEAISFGILGTDSFADGAVTSSKIADLTLDDDEFSVNAEISPSKYGPGNIPIYTTVDTPNYVERSVTVDKLSNDVSEDGVGVWQEFPVKMYVIYPKYFYGYTYGGSLPWWAGSFGVTKLRSPRRYYVAPIVGLDEAKEHEQFARLYSKYCIINDTCFVNVMVRFTNRRQFQSIIYFKLPFDPIAPDNTCIGSGYHVSSSYPRNMPALRAIKLENEAVGFMGHRYRRDRYWWWEASDTSYYAGVFRSPDRFSFNLKYEIARVPLLPANVPTFDTPLRTKDGFTVNITNYDPSFIYTGYAGPGDYLWYRRRFWYRRQYFAEVDFGEPDGNILPITVKYMRYRSRSVLVIRTVKEGYNDGVGWIAGRAHYWWWPYPYWPYPGVPLYWPSRWWYW